MFKNVVLLVLAAVAALGVVIAMRPPTYVITRSTTVAAPPAIAFAQVNDFHKWEGWSPWDKLDPAMQKSYSGPTAGVGAGYAWSSTGKAGKGGMTITESRPAEEVIIKLEFIKPFAATTTTTFSFVPDGPNTRVTWTMAGKNNYIAKAFSLFANMDKALGNDFENGLAAMKVQAETATQQHAAAAAALAAPAPAAAAPGPTVAAAPAAQ